MSDIFVHSGATGTNDGTTWANAYTTFGAAVTASAAGDRIIVADSHYEYSAAQLIYTFADVRDNPVIVISSSVIGSTTITYSPATSAQISSGADNDEWSPLTIKGTVTFFGVWLKSSSQIYVNRNYYSNNAYYDCTLEVGKSGQPLIGVKEVRVQTLMQNCKIIDNNATNVARAEIFYIEDAGSLILIDCNYENAGAISYQSQCCLFNAFRAANLFVRGGNFSAYTGGTLVGTAHGGAPFVDISNAATPAGIITTFEKSYSGPCTQLKTFISDSVNGVTRKEEAYYSGSIVTDLAIYLNAQNDGTGFSDKAVSESHASFAQPLRYKLCDFVMDAATAKTVTVEIAQDGTTTSLTNADIWIEIEYPDDLTTRSHFKNNGVSIAATSSDHPTSSELWVGLSGTNVKQKLQVTTTETGKKGVCTVWVCLTKPSTTIYIDPKITVA